MEKQVQITWDLKNHSNFAHNLESYTRSRGDMNNLATIAYFMEKITQLTSHKKKIQPFHTTWKIIQNLPAT